MGIKISYLGIEVIRKGDDLYCTLREAIDPTNMPEGYRLPTYKEMAFIMRASMATIISKDTRIILSRHRFLTSDTEQLAGSEHKILFSVIDTGPKFGRILVSDLNTVCSYILVKDL